MKLKLFHKIFFFTLILFLVASIISLIVFTRQQTRAVEKLLLEENILISQMVSLEIETGYLTNLWPFETLKKITASGNIIHWRVIKPDGEVVLASEPELWREKLTHSAIGTKKLVVFDDVLSKTKEVIRVIVAPLDIKEDARPWSFWMAMSCKPILEARKKIIYTNLFLSFPILLLVGIFSFFLARHISRPIMHLVQATEKISKGNLDYRVEALSNDELGQLSFSFNKMTEDLEKTMVSRDELAREIDERKRTEEALRYSEGRFRDVTVSSGDWIWEIDAKGSYIYSSTAIKDILGYAPEEVLGKYYYDFFASEDKQRLILETKAAFDKKESFLRFVNKKLHKNGNVVIIETTSVPILDKQGNLLGYRGVDRDITERILAQEKLFRLNRLYSMLSNINQSIVRIRQQEGLFGEICRIIVEQGRFRMSWIGLKDDDLIKPVAHYGFEQGYLEAIKDRDKGPLDLAKDALRQERAVVCTDIKNDPRMLPWRKQALERGYHSCASFPFRIGKEVVGVFTVYAPEAGLFDENELGLLNELTVDISYALNYLEEERLRKKAEEDLKSLYEQLKATQVQLVQSAKMASVGLLAGGVAHEINNPLTGVLNNVQLIRMMAEQKKDFNLDDFKALLTVVEDSAQRCIKITRSLLDFSRSSKGVFQNISLNEIVEKVVILIEHELKLENIIIQREFSPNSLLVSADPQLLQQAIFDIISNAKWAIKEKFGREGGLITIRTTYDVKTKDVFLYISDTGIGISQENLEKVFEPFFTTKNVGEGTGLGLSICYSIIKEHKGRVEVESQLNQGATFKIILPGI